jgi:D-alanyl-lipoteichoic acid acyltransferase DltB (MBOAT superfamily)
MLFNSIDFAIFLPIVFILYWFVTNRNLKLQNLLIVVSSFVFYGWWDWRFLILMVGTASVDFIVGILLSKQENTKNRKILLSFSIIANLGILGFFKYFNFFVDNFVNLFSIFGTKFNPVTIQIVLPVGISFYTFQALSYTIDVYRKELEPTKSIIDYFAFISFFPQLVAGPIERATNLLPQFYQKRTFDYSKAVDGLRQILWGLFKKIVIADNCAEFVNQIFNSSADYSGYTLILGAIFFAFQIYCDFSGYSDIALGTARLFGFNLMRNFAFPYFSRDIAEFWRRWHISLSTWFRDYLYIPLGGSKGGTIMKIRNTFIIFVVSGFWHGANWTFIVWGALNAVYFLPLLLANKNRTNIEIVAQGKFLPTIKESFQIALTFGLTIFAWIFFRANNLEHAFDYIQRIFIGIIQDPDAFLIVWKPYKQTIILIIFFVFVEWLGREKQHVFHIENTNLLYKIRWFMYVFVALQIFIFGNFNKTEFIYFAF